MSPSPQPADTRQRLLDAGLRVLARLGPEWAPVRAINAAAKVRHQSALYYHFGDRWGFVEAVFAQAIGPMLASQIERLAVLERGELLVDIDAVLRALVEPALAAAAGPQGHDRLLLAARLLDEGGDRGQALVARHVRPVAERAERLLGPLLPHLSPESLKARTLYALNLLLHTLADRGMQRHWGLAGVGRQQLVDELLAFLRGGIMQPLPDTPHLPNGDPS